MSDPERGSNVMYHGIYVDFYDLLQTLCMTTG